MAVDADASVAGLDAAAVATWLASLGLDVAPPLRLHAIGAGKSNITAAAVDADGRRWVVRRPPLGRLLASAHDVGREHRVLAALRTTAVPAPRALALAPAGAVADAPVLLMEHVDGAVVGSTAAAAGLTRWTRGAIGRSMAVALASVHAVDLDACGLSDLGPHSPYAERQLRRWSRQWDATRTRPLPAVDRLAERLAAARPAPGELTLVHGDFHLSNVLVDPGAGEVVAVLDWELATLGDPLADLGGLLAYWAQPGDPPGALFDASTVPGFPSRRDLVAMYAAVTGRDLGALGFWTVLALWKVAIIVEGVRQRAQADPRNAARGATAADGVVEGLLARAESVAAEHGI